MVRSVFSAAFWIAVMLGALRTTPSSQACGSTLTSDLVLTSDLDLTGCTGTALTIGADGITIDGQGHTIIAPDASVVVFLNGRTGVSIRNLIIAASTGGSAGTGIEVTRSSNNRIEGCKISGRAVGVAITDPQGVCSGNFVQGNDLSGNKTAVYGGSQGSGNQILSNDLSSSTEWAIQFYYDSAVAITGNLYTGSANGIALSDMDGFHLSGEVLNTITGNALSAVRVTNSAFTNLPLDHAGVSLVLHNSSDNQIVGVTASGTGSGTGFVLSGASSNNRIESCTATGRAVGVSVEQQLPSGNVIQNNTLCGNVYGVYGHNPAQGNKILHNDLSASSGYSIVFGNDSAIEIFGNVYTGSANGIALNDVSGIHLSGEPLDTITGSALRLTRVTDSFFTNLPADGASTSVVLVNSSENLIAAVTACGSGAGTGFDLAGSSSNNRIEGCTATGRTIGVSVGQQLPSGNVIQGNTLSGNVYGVYGNNPAQGNKILNNDLSAASGYSIVFGNDSAIEIVGNVYADSANGIALNDVDGIHLAGEALDTIAGSALRLTRVTNSSFTNLPADGASASVVLVNSSGNLIASVTASGSGTGTGFDLAGSSSNNRIEGCTATGRTIGVSVGQQLPSGNVIQGNTLSGNVYGVYGNNPAQGNRIISNDLSAASSYAIVFGNDNALEISGNVYAGSANGIALNDMIGTYLTGEVMTSIAGTSLALTRVSNSTFSNLFAAGTEMGVRAVNCYGNVFSNVDAAGTSAFPGGGGFALVNSSANTLEGVTAKYRSVGIDVQGADNSVRCSTLTQNETGVRVGTSSPGNHVRNCQITGNLLGINAGSVLDAEDNYWGAASGPAPLGTGDSFAGDVDSVPFFASLTTVFAGCPGMRNESPVVACSGGGTYQAGTDTVTLEGTVSDLEGDSISYAWHEGELVLDAGIVTAILGGEPVSVPALHFTTGASHLPEIGLLGVGAHTLILTTNDGHNPPVDCLVEVVVLDTLAPSLAPVSNVGILWPPNHQLVDIVIEANALDLSGGAVTLTATVTSSQPADGTGDGSTEPDFTEPIIDPDTGTISVQLRAERAGNGPARTYTITLTATDSSGNVSTAIVTVQAPRNQARGR